MGAIGEAIGAYAQPLLDQTDGSIEQVNKALQLAMLCWNLAILPEASREKSINDMRDALKMTDDAEFAALRDTVIMPMIRRHEEMFPAMHGGRSRRTERVSVPQRMRSVSPARREEDRNIGRNDPCPCGSGKKYKRCCGR